MWERRMADNYGCGVFQWCERTHQRYEWRRIYEETNNKEGGSEYFTGRQSIRVDVYVDGVEFDGSFSGRMEIRKRNKINGFGNSTIA